MSERAETVKQLKEDAKLTEQAQQLDKAGIQALRDRMPREDWEQLYEKWKQLRELSKRQRLARKVAYRKRERQLKAQGWQTTRQLAQHHELAIDLTRRMLRQGQQKRLWRCEKVGRRLWWKPTSRNKRGRLPALG